MKLLVVNTVPFQSNGITSVILNYHRNLDKTHLQIDFVALSGINGPLLQELEAGGSRVYSLPRKGNPLSYMWKLYRLLRKGRYDIIHIHGNSATMAVDLLPAVLSRVPVRIAHGHSTSCTHQRAHKLLGPLFHRCYTCAVACSQAAGSFLFGSRPFTVLHNGVDLDQFRFDSARRQECRRSLGAEDKLLIGHVGYFEAVKNHEFLLRSFAALTAIRPDSQLVLIGDGALRPQMEALAKELGIAQQVTFTGSSSHVCDYLQAMDVFVLPSLYEGLPVVLVEAQAAGLPCMVSEAVSRESDLTQSLTFLPIQDPQCWADALGAFQPVSRQETCQHHQRCIRQRGYDVSANAQWLGSFYERSQRP